MGLSAFTALGGGSLACWNHCCYWCLYPVELRWRQSWWSLNLFLSWRIVQVHSWTALWSCSVQSPNLRAFISSLLHSFQFRLALFLLMYPIPSLYTSLAMSWMFSSLWTHSYSLIWKSWEHSKSLTSDSFWFNNSNLPFIFLLSLFIRSSQEDYTALSTFCLDIFSVSIHFYCLKIQPSTRHYNTVQKTSLPFIMRTDCLPVSNHMFFLSETSPYCSSVFIFHQCSVHDYYVFLTRWILNHQLSFFLFEPSPESPLMSIFLLTFPS